MSADGVPADTVLEAIQFPVSGMVCGSCVNQITRALKRLGGVSAVRVDLGRELVTVRRRPDLTSDAEISAALSTAGYEADLDAAVHLPLHGDGGLLSHLIWRSGRLARR